MKIVTIESDDSKTFILKGEIDSPSLINLENTLNDFVDNDERDAIINLESIQKINSLSLAVFIGCKRKLSDTNRKFKLVNPNENVIRVLEMASLDKFLLEG